MSIVYIDNHFYYLDNNETNDIINKYHIGRNILFNELEQEKGCNILYKEMEKQLKFFNEYDTTGIILIMESYRFLIFLIYYQKHKFNIWEEYYKKLLKLFHSLGYLKFKKSVSNYKDFRHKEPLLELVIRTNYINSNITYNCCSDLISDFGRYKTDKILNLREERRQKSVLELSSLMDIIND